jgi:hypothetical protein
MTTENATWLADVLRDEGLTVVEPTGWPERGTQTPTGREVEIAQAGGVMVNGQR